MLLIYMIKNNYYYVDNKVKMNNNGKIKTQLDKYFTSVCFFNIIIVEVRSNGKRTKKKRS